MQRYTAEQVAEAAGVPPPTLRALVARGILRPSIQRAEGRGTANVFSFEDVVAASAASAVRRLAETFTGLLQLTDFLQRGAGKPIVTDTRKRAAVVIVIAADGLPIIADRSETIGDLLSRTGARSISAIDIDGLAVDATETLKASLLTAPGPTGRAPRGTAEETLARNVEHAFMGKRAKRRSKAKTE